MMRGFRYVVSTLVLAIVAYFLLWPVPIEPVSWQSPPNPGYEGPYAVNERLKGLEVLEIGIMVGPEDIEVGPDGRIYAAGPEGIARLDADGSNPQLWVDTGGRPLGIDFDAGGNLIVGDAFLGLLSVTPDGKVTVLANQVGGRPMVFVDDVNVASDGRIYFADASARFGAKEFGGTFEAALLDLIEHSASGRMLVYDPADGTTKVLVDNVHFANGIAVDPDERFVLLTETGSYRVRRHWLQGPKAGSTDVLIDQLPGFPDNVSTGLNGRFWIALVSPRDAIVDAMSDKPFLRKMIQRMPAFLRPRGAHYGHIIAVDADGNVIEDLQDPDGRYPFNTSVHETEKYLYLGNTVSATMARLDKSKAGLN
jgi:hypothetical protein